MVKNNENILAEFVKITMQLINNIPDQILAIKNKDGLHVYASPAYCLLVGKSLENLLKLRSCSVSLRFNHDTPQLNQPDTIELEVLTQKRSKSYIRIHDFKTGIIPRTFIKSPIIDSVTNDVIGLFVQCFEFGGTGLDQNILNIDETADYSNIVDFPVNLSKREKQLIFFCIAKLGSQEIANMISKIENKIISKNTIDNIFQIQLFNKFGVYSRQALYVKLMQLGYNKFIPKEVLTVATFPTEKLIVY